MTSVGTDHLPQLCLYPRPALLGDEPGMVSRDRRLYLHGQSQAFHPGLHQKIPTGEMRWGNFEWAWILIAQVSLLVEVGRTTCWSARTRSARYPVPPCPDRR